MNVQDLAAQLSRVTHFADLAPADLAAIIVAGSVRPAPVGSLIFLEGEPGAGMFVLLAGEVHLCKLGPQGQEQIMAVLHPVIMFNEVTVLDGGPNPVTARAVQACALWQVNHAAFHALALRYPSVGLSLLKVLARRNRFLISQYEDLSFRSVQARLAKLLLDLSQSGRQPIERRQQPISRMAARIATVPEAISRGLGVLKRQGVIATDRARITVLRPWALADLAQVVPELLEE